jgi:hypothetical protein
VGEMGGMLAAGKPIPETVETRLQNELDLALELIAGMDDSQAVLQLEQVRQRAKAQYQTTTKLMFVAPESAEPLLLKTHACLQEQIRLASMGEMDLQAFRLQIRQRFQNKGGSGEQTPGTGNNPQSPGPMSPTGSPMPSGTGNGQGSVGATGTPMPSGTGNGQGSVGATGTPVPSGTGNGSGQGGNQPGGTPGHYGPGSQTPDWTPQPGGGSGHGP